MKKLISVMMICAMLLGSVCAHAAVDVEASLKKLSDDDLRILQYYLLHELQSRGLKDSDNPLLDMLEPATSDETMVYATARGSKYHKNVQCGNAVCTRSMTVAEALSEDLTPCSRCNPPTK